MTLSGCSQMSNVETWVSLTRREPQRRSSEELFSEHRQLNQNGMSSLLALIFCVYLVLSADVGECRGMSGDVVASLGVSAWTSGLVLVRRGHSEYSFRFLRSAVDSFPQRGLKSATRFA